jgi:hypothetical protein
MSWKHALLVLLMVMVLSACVTTTDRAAQAEAGDSSRFEGTWRGTINGFHAPGLYEGRVWNNTLEFRIAGHEVDVLILKKGEWKPVKPIRFKLDGHLSNAVIYATHSRDARWLSTWSFTVTHREEDLLLVYWYRVVDNPVLPEEHKDRSYAFGGVGEMKRISKDRPEFSKHVVE